MPAAYRVQVSVATPWARLMATRTQPATTRSAPLVSSNVRFSSRKNTPRNMAKNTLVALKLLARAAPMYLIAVNSVVRPTVIRRIPASPIMNNGHPQPGKPAWRSPFRRAATVSTTRPVNAVAAVPSTGSMSCVAMRPKMSLNARKNAVPRA